MKKNVIILTSGLSGSSVLAALLAQDGYWVGEQTIKKRDYDTWENAELVELNKRLLHDIGFEHDWTMNFDPDWPQQVTEAAAKLDPAPYRNFVERCMSHQPWLWKDPRLWLTIRYWQQFIPADNVCYLGIHRDPLQSWISTTLRRQIQTFRLARDYEEGIHRSIAGFFAAAPMPSLDLLYEDLIRFPGRTIDSINRLAATELSEADFVRIFRGKLYRKQHGLLNLAKACAIYMKNA